MKKSLFFLLIIFSVFSFYKSAFAYTATQGTATVDPATYHITSFNGWNLTGGVFSYKFCVGNTFDNCTTSIQNSGLISGEPTDYIPANSTLQCGFAGGDCGTISTPDGDYYLDFWDNPGTAYTGNQKYFMFNRTGGVWTAVNALAVGINSQLTPIASSSVPYNVSFTGTYTDENTYDKLIFFVDDLTPSPHEMHTFYADLTNLYGSNISYLVNNELPAGHSYIYAMALFNSATGDHTTLTTDVAFNTTNVAFPDVNSYATCSITDIPGCLQNVLVYLFIPSQDSLNQFSGLYNLFIHKPPFGYVVAINSALLALNDTNTSAFTLQSLPILNTYIFDPIRSGLIWIFWVVFSFVFFNRLKNIVL